MSLEIEHELQRQGCTYKGIRNGAVHFNIADAGNTTASIQLEWFSSKMVVYTKINAVAKYHGIKHKQLHRSTQIYEPIVIDGAVGE